MKKNIQHGTSAFLAYVTAKPKEEQKVEDIPIVCKYSDVFAKASHRLPPDREIEFSIDEISGTQPIYKAPYRMTLAELKELKEQLQELINRGLIRPSV